MSNDTKQWNPDLSATLEDREHTAIERMIEDDAAGVGPAQDPGLYKEMNDLADADPSFVERAQISEVLGADIGALESSDDLGGEDDVEGC